MEETTVQKKVMLSGIQPSGDLHLGNYLRMATSLLAICGVWILFPALLVIWAVGMSYL